MELKIVYKVPKEFYTIEPKDVHKLLNGPTIIHIEGASDEAIFISTLLHGNETTSFLVLQKFLKQFENTTPSKTIIAFLGNTISAQEGLRHLPNQPDYNRIWGVGNTKEHLLATKVFLYAKKFNLFASIDIHNNTGKNPFYACINTIENESMHLASLFSDKVVFYTEPSTVQSMAFTHLCPSVTLEAGLPGNEVATSLVLDYLNNILELSHLNPNFDYTQIDVFHTVARILVDSKIKLDFNEQADTKNDVSFIKDLDELNFKELSINQLIAYSKEEHYLKVVNNSNIDVTSEYFYLDSFKLKLLRKIIPAMLSQDESVIKQDCVGYLMEKMFLK